MNDEGRTQRDNFPINEGGEAGRGRSWSKRWRECWRRDLRLKEEGGGREIRAGQTGEAGGGGRREGREGGRHQ